MVGARSKVVSREQVARSTTGTRERSGKRTLSENQHSTSTSPRKGGEKGGKGEKGRGSLLSSDSVYASSCADESREECTLPTSTSRGDARLTLSPAVASSWAWASASLRRET